MLLSWSSNQNHGLKPNLALKEMTSMAKICIDI